MQASNITQTNQEITMPSVVQAKTTELVSVGNLDKYMSYVSTLPMFDAQQEQQLAKQSFYEKSQQAMHQLIASQLRFVVYTSKKFLGYGLALADLIQEGNIGLLKAAQRFNPDFGVRFVSYASNWIKAELFDFIIKNWRIVKVATTKAQRKLFFNLRQKKKTLNNLTQYEVSEIAQSLNVDEKDVTNMEQRLYSSDMPFDYSADENEESESKHAALKNYQEDKDSDLENSIESEDWQDHQEKQLYHAIKQLDSRSQDIISQRWLSNQKSKLLELADKYGISAERVRQLESNAMDKLKLSLLA